MKKHTIKNIALLAIAGLGIITSANAAPTYNKGDLMLGFYSTNSSTSYLVDLGAASNFRDFSGTETLSLGNIGADLTAVYGSGWVNDNSLFWGVFGANYNTAVNGDPSNTLYASMPEGTLGVQAQGYQDKSSGGQSTPASKINTMGNTYAGLNVTDSSNSSVAVIEANGTSGSFGFYVTNGGAANFAYFNSAMGNFADGTAGTALDLFRMQTSTLGSSAPFGTYEGTFTIDNSGTVTFATPVPEPSTVYAALALVGIIAFRARRHFSAFLKA
jgi:hypothetical protein